MGKHGPGKHTEEGARAREEQYRREALERTRKFEEDRIKRNKEDEEQNKRLEAMRNVLPPKGWKGF